MATIHILLVEDNEGDILLAREAIEDLNLNVDLHVARDGEQAIRYIFQKEEFSGVATPDLVLLDINLPKINGFDVLKKIKGDTTTCKIPVIMFTTSASDTDIKRAYKNFANGYIVKPDSADQLIEAMQTIEKFWVEVSQLPPN